MKVRAFVLLSSLALFSWLTATFVRVVPMHTYDPELLQLQVAHPSVGPELPATVVQADPLAEPVAAH